MHPTKESLKKGKEPAEPRFQPEIEAYPHLFFAQKRWSLRKIDTNTQVHPHMEGRPFSKHSGTRIEPMTKIATDNCSKAEVAVPPRRESATTQTARLAQLATQPRSFYAKQTQFPRSQDKPNFLWAQGLWVQTTSSHSGKTNPIKPNFSPTAFCGQPFKFLRMGATMEEQALGREENLPYKHKMHPVCSGCANWL